MNYYNNSKVIALAGNPNVGKSTIFNALTGLKQHTGNWTGKTVTLAKGITEYNNTLYTIVDLPGTYSLAANSKDEEVARDFICFSKPDAIIIVCDAACLERNLYLALQTLKITKKVILCVNLLDEAHKKNIFVNLALLSKELGIPVIGTSATSKQGIDTLMNAVETVSNSVTSDNTSLNTSPNLINNPIKLYTQDLKSSSTKELLQTFSEDTYMTNIMQYAQKLKESCVLIKNENYYYKDLKIDRILTGKLTGIPIMLLFVVIIFWLTLIGSNYPSQLLGTFLFWFENHLLNFAILINCPYWIYAPLIKGCFHVLVWVVSVMLPPMAIFFPMFTILEDLGYLPRVAFNLEHQFRKCCSCGKQALCMLMGFGCNAVGVVGCRIIDSPRERLIAVITNSIVPCNGRFPTLTAIIAMYFIGNSVGLKKTLLSSLLLAGIIAFSVALTFILSRLLSKTILKGIPSSFTLELPPYRKPQFGKIIVRSLFDRTLFILGRAVIVAAPAGFIIWLLANTNINNAGVLSYITTFLDPFGKLIGLDGVIITAFILGFPANEIVIPIMIMTYLSSGYMENLTTLSEIKDLFVLNGWTPLTAVCTIIFSLMHWPCSTTCITIKKETGSIKWTVVSFLVPACLGIFICFVVAGVFRFLGFLFV